jgi:hypothetical protein
VPLSADQRSMRAALAAATRHHPDTADEFRRDLKASRAEDYIKSLVDEAPRLSETQRDRLALLLHGGAPPGLTASGRNARPGGTTSAEDTDKRRNTCAVSAGGAAA